MPDPAGADAVCRITVADGRWPDLLPDVEAVVCRAVAATLAARPAVRVTLPDGAGHEVSVELQDDASVQRLNAHWRGLDQPTNVLSFPLWSADPAPGPAVQPADQPVALGDVVLALETCAAEADAAGRPLDAHLSHLVVHAVLHLLGHDHQDPAEATEMEALEQRVLADLGHPDPYADTEPLPAPATGTDRR